MKKIVYILTAYPCPSETFAAREIYQLRKQGFEISIFAAKSKGEESTFIQSMPVYYRPTFLSFNSVLSIVSLCLGHPVRLLKFIALLVKLLFTCPKDAITVLANFHTVCFFTQIAKRQHIEHIHAYFLSWPACIALGTSILAKLPFSIAAHSRDIFVEKGNIQLKAKKTRFINCCTLQGLNYLKKKISHKYHNKLFLNYHGIELNEYPYNKFCNQMEDSSKIVIAVGRLVAKKGFIHLVRAFSLIAQKHPQLSLIIAGDGPQKHLLRETITRLGLTDNIHLTGWLDHNQTIRLIRKADCLVVPSIIDINGDRDGIPNVILEAFSVGTPVIASNLSGISEVVSNELTGLLMSPGSKIELASAMDKLLTNEKLVTFLVDNAKKELITNFNIENNCSELANIFKNGGNCKKDKIKIAHIIEGFTGGTCTYLCNVLDSLANSGFDITLICSFSRRDVEYVDKIENLKRNGVKVHTVSMTRAINPIIDIYSLFAITKILRKGKYDVVHTHCSKAGALGRIAARLAGTKRTFHSSHCFSFLRCGNFLTKKIYLSTERLLAKFTTKFIAVSKADAHSAKKWKIFTDDKCVIINNGLSPNMNFRQENISDTVSKIKASFNLPKDTLVVATGCRLVGYKGIFTFLEAAKLSKNNATFAIAGDGPLKPRIEKYITTNGLSNKVRLLGHISDMDRLYNICDLVALCSQREGQSYLLLEAMRANCTIIASDVPGNRELLDDERGLLVDIVPKKVTKAIDYLLNDSRKRKRLAQNAYEYFYNNHKLEDQIQKLTRVYLDGLNIIEKDYNIAGCRTEKIHS